MGTAAQWREGDMFLLHLQKHNAKQVALQICALIATLMLLTSRSKQQCGIL